MEGPHINNPKSAIEFLAAGIKRRQKRMAPRNRPITEAYLSALELEATKETRTHLGGSYQMITRLIADTQDYLRQYNG